MHDKRGEDQVECLIFERQGLVQIRRQQAGAPFQAPLCDLEHAGAGIDPGDDGATLDERRRMRPAAASRIEHRKSGDFANQGQDCRTLIIGIPGVRFIIGVIGRREGIIIILGHICFSRDRLKTLFAKLASG